jgi:hypothetical protein
MVEDEHQRYFNGGEIAAWSLLNAFEPSLVAQNAQPGTLGGQQN